MDATVNQKEYKSPIRKLAAFFEKSRDRWKDKYIGAKADVKRLKNKVRFLVESKNALKQRLKVLESEMGILHLSLKVVYTFRKHEFGQSYSVGNN